MMGSGSVQNKVYSPVHTRRITEEEFYKLNSEDSDKFRVFTLKIYRLNENHSVDYLNYDWDINKIICNKDGSIKYSLVLCSVEEIAVNILKDDFKVVARKRVNALAKDSCSQYFYDVLSSYGYTILSNERTKDYS